MRIRRLDNGQRATQRLFLRLMAVASRRDAPDVVKTMLYRPGFFGRPFSALTHQVMRGPSPWAVGERELFAAFTSKLNQCPF
jgi:hypothetical protein